MTDAPPKDNFSIFKDVETDKDQVIADLEQKVEHCEKKRLEERFYWVFIFLLIIDSVLFMYVVDGLAALSLSILQIIFLFIFAEKCDVKSIEMIFNRALGILKGMNDKS